MIDRVGQVWVSANGSLYLITRWKLINLSKEPGYGWDMIALYENTSLNLRPGRLVQMHESYLVEHLELVA